MANGPVAPPVFQMLINNTLIGTPTASESITPNPGVSTILWRKYSVTWNSGTNTTANLILRNTNFVGNGNDFALDDILMRRICTYNDVVTVTVATPISVTIIGAPFCAGSCGILTANVIPANGTYTYAWGANLGSANQADACEDGVYDVTVTDANGCTATATFTTTRLAAPTAAITGPTTICPNTTITLTATGGGTYDWGGSITTPTRTVSAVGIYTVTVTGANGCTATASYQVTAAHFLLPNCVISFILTNAM
jgi:hypothetical protein